MMNDRADSFTRWIFPALVFSLLLHLGVIFYVWNLQILDASPVRVTLSEAAPFKVQEVTLPPPPQAKPSENTLHASAPEALPPPDEKISMGKMTAPVEGEPATPDIAHSLLTDKPVVTETTTQLPITDALPAVENSLAPDTRIHKNAVSTGLGSADAEIIKKASAITREGTEAGGRLPGFSNLDDLLAQTGPLQPETAPILMPTDLLFDYDQASLRNEAMESLQKLAALIQRNPKARFRIEGHTDSFGTPEYNLHLSLLRAESVKTSLVEMMHINPSQIETKGYGQTRLIAPASGSIEEQGINRRVEIVILP